MEPLKTVNPKEGLEITLYENQKGKIFGFKVAGYTNFAPNGYDIYNAAFSQIFFGTINSIVTLTGVSDYILEEARPFIRFVIPRLQDTDDEKIFILFDSMVVQIQMVLEEMKQKGLTMVNVKVKKSINF
nr:ribosomal-processing cysteine protease Prp [Saccharococcus thermophilus]